MMENSNRDKITKAILESSFLEISSPGFTDTIVHKIKAKRRQRAVVNYALSCVLFIIIVMVLIVFSIPASQPVTGNVSIGLGIIEINILNTGTDIAGWFTDNLFLLGAIAILFLCKKGVDIKLKHAGSKHKLSQMPH